MKGITIHPGARVSQKRNLVLILDAFFFLTPQLNHSSDPDNITSLWAFALPAITALVLSSHNILTGLHVSNPDQLKHYPHQGQTDTLHIQLSQFLLGRKLLGGA